MTCHDKSGVTVQAARQGKIFEGRSKSAFDVEVKISNGLCASERGATSFQSFSG